MPTKTPRSYTFHDPTDIAKRAVKLGSGFTGSQLGSYAVIRKATGHGLIKPLKDAVRNGKRGRPAVRYTPTLKARNLAKRA